MQQTTTLATTIPSQPTKIIIPDLVSHCDFALRCNRHRKQASNECKRWLFRGGNLSEKKRNAFHGLKAGLLTSWCYPNAAYGQLRVCCDFMNWLFHLDNISDDMNDRGTVRTGVDIMNTLYHPHSYRPTSRVGKMTKEFVSHSSLIHLFIILTLDLQTASGSASSSQAHPECNNVSWKLWISSSKP